MKISTCLMALGLTLGVTADIAAFKEIIAEINAAVVDLTPLVTGYTGGPGTDIISASDDLVGIINKGIEKANAQPTETGMGGLDLTQPVLDLIDDVKVLVGGLVDKKELAIENDIAGLVKANLAEQFEASGRLATAISVKMGKALEDIAAQLAGQVSDAIKVGVDAYADVPDSTGPTAGPTDEPTAGPTAGPTDAPTDGPTPTAEPTGAPEPTCDAEATETVTVTVTECGEVPEPTSSGPAGTGSFTVPVPPVPTVTGPPDFDNAAAMTKVGGVGALAALAVVLAF